jgi:lipoprotein NlpI
MHELKKHCCFLTFFLMFFTAFSTVSAQESPPPDQAFATCLTFDRAACNVALAAKPDNLTALFMRGLAAELEGDDRAALADFDAAATREPRHFGAQLWRYVAALTLDQAEPETFRAYLDQSGLPPWPQALGRLYLGETTPQAVLALAEQQPPVARNEALCAAQYHIGRRFLLAGDTMAAAAAFRAVLATGATHVFEYQSADRTLQGMP